MAVLKLASGPYKVPLMALGGFSQREKYGLHDFGRFRRGVSEPEKSAFLASLLWGGWPTPDWSGYGDPSKCSELTFLTQLNSSGL